MWWKHGPSQLLTVSQAETPDILTGSGAEETSDGGNSSRCCFTSPDYTERWSCCSTHEHTVNIRFHYLHSKLSGAAAPSPAARQPGSPAGSQAATGDEEVLFATQEHLELLLCWYETQCEL